MDWKAIWQSVVNWVTSSGLKLLIALVVMFITFKLINKLISVIEKKNETKNVLDRTISRSLFHALKIALKVLVIVCLVSYVGIDTSGITALIASLGVTIGLAVNGSLSNIAGGVLLLITRPIRVGDFVDIAGSVGTVEDIYLINTKLRTVDNIVIYIPNAAASTATIKNYSMKDIRRVDHTFSISYRDSFEKAKSVIELVLENHEKVLKDPAWQIRLMAHGDHSLNIVCRAWVASADYWDVYFDLLEQVKIAFDENNITIPYNQMDVHIIDDKESAPFAEETASFKDEA